MNLADVASATAAGINPRFFLCASVACLFAVTTVVLLVVMVRRSGTR